MKSEFDFGAHRGLRNASKQVNGNSALSFIFLDIVDVLARYDKNALLVPPEHVDLFQLV